mmetsp:Transcript_1481/g.3585  ORF Transcript_1481/g.3585 Transcript_1481/m.3585 type:complete len:253 (+) Transcript_1481:1277-2035(+)
MKPCRMRSWRSSLMPPSVSIPETASIRITGVSPSVSRFFTSGDSCNADRAYGVITWMYESSTLSVAASPRRRPRTRSKKMNASGHASIGDRPFWTAQLSLGTRCSFPVVSRTVTVSSLCTATTSPFFFCLNPGSIRGKVTSTISLRYSPRVAASTFALFSLRRSIISSLASSAGLASRKRKRTRRDTSNGTSARTLSPTTSRAVRTPLVSASDAATSRRAKASLMGSSRRFTRPKSRSTGSRVSRCTRMFPG